jgi:hypothetical protein
MLPFWIFAVFLVRIPAWIFLGLWFLYQLIEASFGLFNASANGGGVAFFAHVGGFIFGLLTARHLARRDRQHPGSNGAPRRRPAGSSPRRNRGSQAPVAEMRTGPGSGIVSLVINYQQ